MPVNNYFARLVGRFPATLERHATVKAKHLLRKGVYKVLPEAYKKFYLEWKYETPEPVHFIPTPGKFQKNPETGQVEHVKNVPFPLLDSPQMNDGIWGGEAIIQGFEFRYCYTKKFEMERAPKFWFPNLHNGVVYSQVLDKHMTCVLTERAVKLINKHFGLDHYLLKTRACDLRNLLALRLKRKILFALRDRTFCPDDEGKRKEIEDLYMHYLENYTDEEIEWYGLTLEEACAKFGTMKAIEAQNYVPVPLKYQMREEYVNFLRAGEWKKPEEPWWKKKLISYK